MKKRVIPEIPPNLSFPKVVVGNLPLVNNQIPALAGRQRLGDDRIRERINANDRLWELLQVELVGRRAMPVLRKTPGYAAGGCL